MTPYGDAYIDQFDMESDSDEGTLLGPRKSSLPHLKQAINYSNLTVDHSDT
jgi:hypothetical protein